MPTQLASLDLLNSEEISGSTYGTCSCQFKNQLSGGANHLLVGTNVTSSRQILKDVSRVSLVSPQMGTHDSKPVIRKK